MDPTIKVVRCSEPGRLVFEEQQAPDAPPEGWALVNVAFVGICETDYHIFEGRHPYLAYPRIMGHEVSGTIAAINAPVDLSVGEQILVNPYLACGHCAACRQGKPNCCMSIEVLGVHRDGAMSEQILVPAQNLIPAAGLSLVEAATVEFLAIGAHAVRRCMAGPGIRTLVIGAGPIGLGTALFARIAQQNVTVMDVDTERLTFDHRNDSGANCGSRFRRRLRRNGKQPFDAVCLAYVAHGGVMVMVSVVPDDITFSDPEFHKREMMLIGSRNATRSDFQHVIASIRAGKIPIDQLVTHRTTLRDSPRDIAIWAQQKSGLIKAVIDVGSG